jgi:hypothetical protein
MKGFMWTAVRRSRCSETRSARGKAAERLRNLSVILMAPSIAEPAIMEKDVKYNQLVFAAAALMLGAAPVMAGSSGASSSSGSSMGSGSAGSSGTSSGTSGTATQSPGASGYTPGHQMQDDKNKNSTGPGASEYAPGQLKKDNNSGSNSDSSGNSSR